MSIVTLKRKTFAKYNNNSVNSPEGFSLNGTHRSQGYIGQTSLSRSFPRTPMKGNVAKGHGGCCGKYPQGPIIQSAVISQEDPSIVKLSSLSNRGLIDTKYRWIRRPQPFATVDKTSRINNQSDYIYYVQQKTVHEKDAAGQSCYPNIKIMNPISKCTNLKKIEKPSVCPESVVTGIVSKTGAISGGEHIFKIKRRQCFTRTTLSTAYSRTPFTCGGVL